MIYPQLSTDFVQIGFSLSRVVESCNYESLTIDQMMKADLPNNDNWHIPRKRL